MSELDGARSDAPVLETDPPLAQSPAPPSAQAAAPAEPAAEQPSALGLRKFRDRLRIPPVIRAWRRPAGSTIRIRAELTRTRFHSDLPETTVWAYEGSVPGPTIEVARDRETRIDWENGLEAEHGPAPLPYDVVRVPPLAEAEGLNADVNRTLQPGGRGTEVAAGAESFEHIAGTRQLRAHTVVHLHGALTNGVNDGWAHNVADPGETTCSIYPNRQEAAALWYHDHAMAVTRFNVHAGLAGSYLIRDRQEHGLGLPSGDYEVPLLIADRNFESVPGPDGAEPGVFTGRVLYKQAGFTRTPGGPLGELPVTGPFNTVNGTVWPFQRVEPRWYRFRLLNASGSRVYRLAVHDTSEERLPDGEPIPSSDPRFAERRLADAFVVVGTDGGLLPEPYVPEDGVIEMGPAERVDVLVDFSRFPGRTLELRNEAGTALAAQPGQAEASVMQWRVARRRPRPEEAAWRPPTRLNAAYRRYRHRDDGVIEVGDETFEHHGHAWIALIPPNLRGSLHPEMWELAEIPEGEPLPERDFVQLRGEGGRVRRFRPVAKLFDDTTTIMVERGEWFVWNFLHLGGPRHPMHIHMAQFQMIARRQWEIDPQTNIVRGFDMATGSTPEPLPEPGPGRPVSPMDAGMKDTWVVGPGEVVSVLGRFRGAAGSFMYHCHIMDHEDHTMMRPFAVLPPDVMAFHAGHGGGHGH